MRRILGIILGLVWLSAAAVEIERKPQAQKTLGEWIAWAQPISTQKMLANISPVGAAAGVVVASPSQDNPDYFYHWIRDAALVMDVVVSLYARAEGDEKHAYRQRLIDFVDLSLRNQHTPNKSGGVGEPKFLATGEAFNGDWGRPQDDGPALRALVFIRWARILMMEGNYNLVFEKLFSGKWDSVIKTDLEYVSHHWQDRSYDLWEEVRGKHFFTRMVQRRALLDGADLAAKLGDGGAAFWYREQAGRLDTQILKHWNGSIFIATLDRDGGIDYKQSNLDSSVILGALHGRRNDGFLPFSDERLLATAQKIEETFRNLYPINQQGHRGTAIGRYPEDRYNGYSSSGLGNPWFINTNAMSQYYYELSKELSMRTSFSITPVNRKFFAKFLSGRRVRHIIRGKDVGELAKWAKRQGDDYLACTQFHMAEDGSLSEQMNRENGFMQGAHDLTWSYASLLTAIFERF